MDRYVSAESKTESKSAKGKVTATWANSFYFFAAQTDSIAKETLSTVAFVTPVTTTFTTHYRPDLTRKMRLVCDGETWNIISITRDHFQMKIDCERMDT